MKKAGRPKATAGQRVWLVAAICLMVPALYVGAEARDAVEVHWEAWDAALGEDGTEPASPMSFYAYRTIAVPHPEIYLKADQLISDVLENLPGGRVAYTYPDQRDVPFFQRIQKGEVTGPGFSWRQWTIWNDSVKTGTVLSGGDPESILDLRLPSAAVLLRYVHQVYTSPEWALQLYCQKRRLGHPTDGLFVVIDADGSGYLADDTVLIHGIHTWEGNPCDIRPLLVFNEEAVYYPLFGRDDRSRDVSLSSLLGRLGPAAVLDLPVTALQRISRLRTVAALPDTESTHAAILISSGLRDLKNPLVRERWDRYRESEDTTSCACLPASFLTVLCEANRLSPVAAGLSCTITGDDLGTALLQVSDKYLALCGRRVAPVDSSDSSLEAFAVLWSYGLFEIGLDDIVRTRAGGSSSQAYAMSAILDLAAVAYAEVLVPDGRLVDAPMTMLLAGGGRYECALGIWSEVAILIERANSRGIKLLGFRMGKSAARFHSAWVCTDSDALTFSTDLAAINRLFPYTAVMIGYGGYMVAYTTFVSGLATDRVPLRPFSCTNLF
jgi:hypothetical protein